MVPIKCDTPGKAIPFATMSLIAMCILSYIKHELVASWAQGFVPLHFADSLFHPVDRGPAVIVSLVLSLFTHAGIIHLVSNMWYLWIFGSAVERHIGAIRFIIIYFISGIFAMLIQGLSNPFSAIPVVGASGAIAGIMGIHFILLPMSTIFVWVPPVFFFRIWAFIFLAAWFGVQYVSLKSAHPESEGIAWWAHVGGYITGSAWGIFRRVRTRKAGEKNTP
ncbi:MAG: rhomboid family intramembrane serine protease [Chitinivibrionales bacterium]|nr:rhomboid family intramembrane serine protease [Chitinivibrionales bacterium]